MSVTIVLAFVMAATHAARAQNDSQPAAAAEALFNTGRKLLDQKHYQEACSNLEESQHLDPAVGTLLYLGFCYEKLGRQASAWSAYRAAESAAARAKQRDRERIARERADTIEPRLARVTVRVAPDIHEPLTIKRDGVVLGQASIGQPMPVDAGTHVLEATAPGRRPWTKTIEVSQGNSIVVEIDALISVPREASALERSHSSRDAGATGVSADHREIVNVRARTGSSQRWLGVAAGSLGLVGLGVGAGFAWHAASKSSDAERYRRPGTNVYDDPGYDMNSEALHSSKIALVSTAVGAAALTSGVVLYLTAGSRASRQPDRAQARLGITNTGVTLSGYWR